MKLLIVDDSGIIRKRIQRYLGEMGLEVVGLAANGKEALEMFRRTRPEVVTMDITMPVMDGITCIQEMIRLNPEVRILVISALADKSTAIEAIKKGAKGYLCKPFTREELREMMEALLE